MSPAMTRLSNVNAVECAKVVIVTSIVGAGNADDPVREVIEVFRADGEFIARRDTLFDQTSPMFWLQTEAAS